MPGELLPAMAAPSITKMKLSRANADLYLIVSCANREKLRKQLTSLQSEEDTIYEQDILREPGSTKPWLAYIEFKFQHGSSQEQAFVLERACRQLPRSYKLWKMVHIPGRVFTQYADTLQYLDFRMKHLGKLNPAIFASEYSKVNALFERALILLNKMPRIWEMYLSFLLLQPIVTLTRHTFDRALRALPITQHNRIWALYRPFANSASGQTAVKIWRRYMQIHPEDAEDFIELLIEMQHYTEAVKEYMKILNNQKYRSKNGKGHYQIWSEMVDLLVEHAKEIETGDEVGIDVDRIIRSGIDRFADQRGKLW